MYFFVPKQIHQIRATGGQIAKFSLKKGEGNTFPSIRCCCREKLEKTCPTLEGEKGILLPCPGAKMAWPSVADFSVPLQILLLSTGQFSQSCQALGQRIAGIHVESWGGKKTGKIVLLSSSSASLFIPHSSLSTFSPTPSRPGRAGWVHLSALSCLGRKCHLVSHCPNGFNPCWCEF